MTHASVYDVIVCGSGSNHLILSALLASRGVNLLLLSTSNRKTFGRDGYQFPDEYPLYIDFGPDGILGEVYADIGIPFSYLKGEDQIFKDLSPAFQVVLPDYRIDIFKEEEDLLDELCRELREEGGQIISLFNEVNRINSLIDDNGEPSIYRKIKALAKRISLSGKNGRNILNRFNPSVRLLGFFDALSLAFYGIGLAKLDALRFFSILRMLKGGGRSVKGENEILTDLLVKKIRSEGGEFYHGEIDEFQIKKNRITGIKTSRGDLFDCKAVVMESNKAKEDLQIDKLKRFSLYFGVDAGFVPSPMADYLLLTRDCSKAVQADNLLMLSLSPLGDLRWAPADKRLITVSTLIPSSQILSDSYLGGLKVSVLANLIWLMPFSGGHIEFIGDDLIFGRVKEKTANPLLSLSADPKNLHLIEDGRDVWIRSSEELKASCKLADQILSKI
ncbi:MAG TPA: hypothetical protein VI584_01310 [Nitrospiria bacterium]|nr:hypothetical protein [Nitrospiria bacterium]